MEASSLLFSARHSAFSNGTDVSSTIGPLTPRADEINEDIFLANHGYVKRKFLSTAIQGEIFLAQSTKNNKYFAVKKTSKLLYAKRVANDKDGFSFIVDEDCVKEAQILRHLTVLNQPIGNTIVKYIDFIESDTHYYLIMEHIRNAISLKDFALRSHKFIANGLLKLSDYQQAIKYILWQLITTMHWLHNDMNCCHLDLVSENILLKNVHFIQHSKGSISINPRMEVKLIDFGASELYPLSESPNSKYTYFACNKQHISIENEQYLSPNISKQDYYNVFASDMWSVGLLIYFCFVGEYPYKRIETTDFNEPLIGTGYWYIYNHKLPQYLRENNLNSFVNNKVVALLNGLLNFNETKRFSAMRVLSHQFFSSYFKRYSAQIKTKSRLQKKQSLLRQKHVCVCVNR